MKLKILNKSSRSGVTLIELTVVIIVLLTLISVMFFVGTAYIKASNRTACLVNQEHLQKAVRGYQSLNQLQEASDFKWSELKTDGYLGDALIMECPVDSVKYVSSDDGLVPALGVRVAPCLDGQYKDDHVPTTLARAIAWLAYSG